MNLTPRKDDRLMDGIATTIRKVQVEAAFGDGIYLVTVQHRIR
jgi:urease gamma subunit